MNKKESLIKIALLGSWGAKAGGQLVKWAPSVAKGGFFKSVAKNPRLYSGGAGALSGSVVGASIGAMKNPGYDEQGNKKSRLQGAIRGAGVGALTGGLIGGTAGKDFTRGLGKTQMARRNNFTITNFKNKNLFPDKTKLTSTIKPVTSYTNPSSYKVPTGETGNINTKLVDEVKLTKQHNKDVGQGLLNELPKNTSGESVFTDAGKKKGLLKRLFGKKEYDVNKLTFKPESSDSFKILGKEAPTSKTQAILEKAKTTNNLDMRGHRPPLAFKEPGDNSIVKQKINRKKTNTKVDPN